jgi:hypothetical protein
MDSKLKQQADAALAKWTPLAAKAEEARAHAPIHVLLGEAVDVASMLAHYWEPTVEGKGKRVPGFSGVAANGLVTRELAEEIRELQLATAVAHSDYLVLVQRAAEAPLDRADFVLGEIRSTLEFVFDDGKDDDADRQLENLRAAFADSASQDAMALALEGYAELAGRHTAALETIEGFETGLIDEARTLAAALRQQSAAALTHTTLDEQRQALALRNRLLMLLLERVKRVRRAAGYLFRNFPAIARKFTSTYERRKRSAKRKQEDTENGAPGEAVSAAE